MSLILPSSSFMLLPSSSSSLSARRFVKASEVTLSLAGISINSALMPVLNCRRPRLRVVGAIASCRRIFHKGIIANIVLLRLSRNWSVVLLLRRLIRSW